MPRVRVLVGVEFQPPGRATIACKPGDIVFVTDEMAAEWQAAGVAQHEAAPYPPPAAPPLYDASGARI